MLQGDTWKPIEKLVDRGVVLKILEQGSDGNASAFEDPGTAHPRRIALGSGARRPVDHAQDGSTAGVCVRPTVRAKAETAV